MDARALIAAAACMLAVGCAAPGVSTMRVPYAIPCQQSAPQRPAMPTDSLTLPVTIDAWVAAAQSEIDVREAYETELAATLQACIRPLQTSNLPQ